MPYSPTKDLVPPIAGPQSVHLGVPGVPYLSQVCDVAVFDDERQPGPDTSDWRGVTQVDRGSNRVRIVSFATQRYDSSGDYDDQMAQFSEWFEGPCVDAEDETIHSEPITIDGLPAGSLTVNWPVEGDRAVSTVIGDRDLRVSMIVVWSEDPGEEDPSPVPTDTFADVVTTAWTEFLAENSR